MEDGDKQRLLKNYERNKPFVSAGHHDYQTHLSPKDEEEFRSWLHANRVPFNPEQSLQDYDMRGFWKGMKDKNPNAKNAIDPNDHKLHYSDYWKTPYHETFSNESQWANKKTAPHWTDDDKLETPQGKILFDDRHHSDEDEDEEEEMKRNNMVVRVSLMASDDTDKIQRVKLQGRAGELYGGQKLILRLQPAGFSSRPSKGTGIVLNLGGNADQAICIALENQDARPTGLEDGESVQYSEFDTFIKLDKDGNVGITATKNVTVDGAQQVIINASDKVYLGGTSGAKAVKLADGSNSTKVFAQ